MNSDDFKHDLETAGKITSKMRKEYFPSFNILTIRAWLKDNNFDSKMPIDAESTEIAIIIKDSILMQIRTDESNMINMFGGEIEPGEKPIEGAIRELREEAGLTFKQEELEFINTYDHEHTYPNGDRVFYHTYRYVIKLQKKPHFNIHNNTETKGIFLLKTDKHGILRVGKYNMYPLQKEFISSII